MNYIRLKRSIKRMAGLTAQVTAPFVPVSSRRACIFVYHRVADLNFIDPQVDDWNVTPAVFERQMAALASFAEVVPLLDLPDRLSQPSRSQRPLVSITFDDGYGNFYSNALPVLRHYNLPVTVFLITSTIGQSGALPFDRWSQRNSSHVSPEAVRVMTWNEVEACLDSGLITIGAHSHTHPNSAGCTSSALVEEAETSRSILLKRLGESCGRAYSYPYGSTRLGQVTAEYVKAVRDAGYQLAVTTDLGLADCTSDVYALPRVEASGMDSPKVLLAKARGALAPFRFTDLLRRPRKVG